MASTGCKEGLLHLVLCTKESILQAFSFQTTALVHSPPTVKFNGHAVSLWKEEGQHKKIQNLATEIKPGKMIQRISLCAHQRTATNFATKLRNQSLLQKPRQLKVTKRLIRSSDQIMSHKVLHSDKILRQFKELVRRMQIEETGTRVSREAKQAWIKNPF